MSMWSLNLITTLKRSWKCAQARRHEFVTPEHLLFALTKDPDAVALLHASDVDAPKLRLELVEYLESLPGHRTRRKPKEAEAFYSVLERAVMEMQIRPEPHEKITGAHVLMSLLCQQEGHAFNCLQNHNLTLSRARSCNYLDDYLTYQQDASAKARKRGDVALFTALRKSKVYDEQTAFKIAQDYIAAHPLPAIPPDYDLRFKLKNNEGLLWQGLIYNSNNKLRVVGAVTPRFKTEAIGDIWIRPEGTVFYPLEHE